MNEKALYFGILTVLFSFSIRLYPELISWPYPLGFDIVSYYIPNILEKNFLSPNYMFKEANFYYLLIQILFYLFGNLPLIFKFTSSILHATLGLIIYIYLYKVTKLNYLTSFMCSLLFSTSVLSFRLTWDLHRNTLGLIFALTSMIYANNWKSKNWILPVSIFIFLTVWTHELVATYLLITMIINFLNHNFKNKSSRQYSLPFAITIIICIILYLHQRVDNGNFDIPISFLCNSYYEHIINFIYSLYFFVFSLWLFIPISIYSIKKLDESLRIWILLSILPLFIYLLSIKTTYIYRYLIMLSFPLFISAFITLKNRYKLCLLILCLNLAIILPYLSLYPDLNLYSSNSLVRSIADLGLDYYIPLRHYMPLGYLQNSIPISNMKDIIDIFNHVNNYYNYNNVIVMPSQLYGLSLLYLKNHSNYIIVNIGEVGYFSMNRGGTFKEILGELYNKYDNIMIIWWSSAYQHNIKWYDVNIADIDFITEKYSNGVFSIYIINRY